MSNLEQILKKMKDIEPDKNYSDRSLNAIIISPRKTKRSWTSLAFLQVIEYGGAVALVGILFLIMIGNSSLSEIFSPIRYGSLNNGGLRAEAEAIDIQINLLDIEYTESSSTTKNSTTEKEHLTKKKIVQPTSSIDTTMIKDLVTAIPTTTLGNVLDILSR